MRRESSRNWMERTMHYLKDVVTLELDVAACIGCGLCVAVCPHAVYRMDAGKAAISDRDACNECGACALNCPVDAISVEAGVGCARAIMVGAIRGTEPCCDGDSCC